MTFNRFRSLGGKSMKSQSVQKSLLLSFTLLLSLFSPALSFAKSHPETSMIAAAFSLAEVGCYVMAVIILTLLLTLLWVRWKQSSQRKKNENQITRSELKYRMLFESAGDYLLILSPQGENQPPLIIDANTAAFTRHGYTREEMIGKPIFILDTPAAALKNRDVARQLVVNGAPLLFESEHCCKDGSIFPVEVSTRLIQTGDDPPIILASERDISARKTEEKILRQSEERFRALFENIANISVQGYGPDGTVRFWNKASEVLYGYSAAEALGKNLVDLIIPPAMKDNVSGAIRFMFESGEGLPAAELELLRKDGSLVPVYSNHIVLEVEGTGKELYCIDVDLSELKKAEEQIKHLNRILLTLRLVDKLVLQEKDPLSFIEKTCHSLVEHQGYSSATIMVRDQSWTPNIVASAGGDGCLKSAEGETSSIESSCMVLKYEGTLYGYIKAVSERANGVDGAERALFEDLAADISFALHSMEQVYLMGRVCEERNRIEVEMRQAQKMEAVGHLAGGIAHDFNNKLTVILCTAELLLAEAIPDSPLYNDLLNIKKAGDQSAALTRQLLSFSRKKFCTPKNMSLNGYVAADLQMLSRLIDEGISIEFIPAKELTDICIDPSHLDQILANLAVNARDAINGTGLITIETSLIVINDHNRHGLNLAVGDYVLLTFGDNGSGMNEETQKNIFDPFFTTKAEGEGTGLGLSTVYGIVQQNHGAIHVESNPGQGTCFRLYFPLVQHQSKTPSEIAVTTMAAGDGTILVVEDNDLLLNMVEAVLVAKGYRILAVASPEDACRLCATAEEEIHLLLTDVIMPVMNGKELQGRIESMRPGIKTLFMSGYAPDFTFARGVDQEMVNFLPKPFTINHLQSKVHSVLYGEEPRASS